VVDEGVDRWVNRMLNGARVPRHKTSTTRRRPRTLSHFISQVRSLLLPGLILILLSSCVAPKTELWPPAADTPSKVIYVSVDTWHAVIGFPLDKAKSSELTSHAAQPPDFEEWGYAERAWYVEGRQGVIGAIRALFWPTEGVVEVGQHHELWAARTPQPPADLFRFRLSETGHERLRRHLQSTIAAKEPIATVSESVFYPARRSYHMFHHCHQYVAHALREAGLPISALGALTRSTLVWQLQRAKQRTGDE
jgi:hypothetical protein